VDNNTLSLDRFLKAHREHKPAGLQVVVEQSRPANRFVRDGWTHVEGKGTRAFRKPDPWWRIALTAEGSPFPTASYGSGHYPFDCALVDLANGNRSALEGVTWADWDQQGRLVFTSDGKVFAGEFDSQGQMISHELADFNADTFEPREAPAWAREW
jgi:hypothetical protein